MKNAEKSRQEIIKLNAPMPKFRKKFDLTLDEAAALLGYSHGRTIRKFENGERGLSATTLKLMFIFEELTFYQKETYVKQAREVAAANDLVAQDKRRALYNKLPHIKEARGVKKAREGKRTTLANTDHALEIARIHNGRRYQRNKHAV